MNFNENYIRKQIESIENDFQSGSTTIARNAVYILKNTVMSHAKELKKNDLIEFARALRKARPSMAALQNIMQTCIYEINLLKDISEFPQKTFKILTDINTASDKCINNALQIIKENNFKNLITCSFSSTVLKFFETIHASEYDFKVNSLESVFNKINYGMRLFDKCTQAEINAEYINMENIDKILPNIDCAIIGADRILPDGGVVNGIPSLLLAQNMKTINKPFYVIAETFKSSDRIIVEQGFEFIDRKFITKLITNNISA